MKKSEINEFIERTEEFGDEWTQEQVEEVYGDRSLEDALADRRSLWGQHAANISALLNN